MINNNDYNSINSSSLEEFSLEEFSAPRGNDGSAAWQQASASNQQIMPDAELLEDILAQANTKRRFNSVMRSTVGTLLVVAAIAALVAMFVLPILQIHGSSMTPNINEGEIVVALKGSTFNKSDVVGLYIGNKLLVKRVIGAAGDWIDIKSDGTVFVNGEIVMALKGSTFQKGDIVGLYIGNKLLVKRVIGGAGDWIDIKSDGTVFVNGEMIDEPYVTDKALGDCNINLPYQVPDGRYFVMGDHRSTSADSRNTAIGCVAYEQIVGRIVFRIWPFSRFGRI